MRKLPFLFAAMMLPTSAFAQPISLTIGQDIQPEQAIEEITTVYKTLGQTLKKTMPPKARHANTPLKKSRDEALHNPLPYDLNIYDVQIHNDQILVRLEGSFGNEQDLQTKNGLWLAEYQQQLLYNHFAELNIQGDIRFEVRDKITGQFRPLMPTVDDTPEDISTESNPISPAPLSTRSLKLPLGGSLSGKRVALSAGHGWDNGWERPFCNFDSRADGVQEDMTNAIFINRWVIPLLQNMGAEVISVREPDFNQDYKIVDNGDAGYSESGAFQTSESNSSDGTRFRHGSNYRYSTEAGAKATWSHTFTTSAHRRIQVWYPDSDNRPTDVKYTVKSGNGTFEYTINQTQYGRRYVDLGLHWCVANVPCSVTVERVASSGALIADAAKFGSTQVSGTPHPLWKMGGQYYVNDYTLGKKNAIHTDGITTRPRFAKRAGADVYVSIHTNALNGCSTAEGSNAYGYVTYNYADGVSGMKKFGNMVHNAVIGHIHRDYDSTFYNRGLKSYGYAELKGGMPSVLLELAFHDNIKPTSKQKQSDNEAIQDPRFKQAVAMGIADGIAQYFSKSDQSDYKMGDGLPPARPTQIRAQNTGNSCELTISWAEVPGAEEYLLYKIDNLRPEYERAWDSGTRVKGTSTVLKDLQPGRAYAFKLAAVNKNGISYPSPAVTARVKGVSHNKKGLYINGYTRWDAIVNYHVDNDLDYAAEHGIALSAAGETVYFDGITIDAAPQMALKNYDFIDFQAGQNDEKYRIMPESTQNALTTYVNDGGKLLISGTDIGKVLSKQGTSLLNNTLKINYATDDAKTFAAKGAGKFSALTSLNFDDGKHGIYPADRPDVFTNAGAETILTYDNSQIAAAATSHTIAVGFPLETIYPAKARAQFVACAIHYLLNGSECTPDAYNALPDGAPVGQCAQCDNTFAPICENKTTLKSCQNELFITTPCPENQHCVDNACVDIPECEPNETRCSADNNALEVCTDGKFALQPCPENQHCVDNACVDIPECETDEIRCSANNDAIEICTDGKFIAEPCPENQHCAENTCVPNDDEPTDEPSQPETPLPPQCNDSDAPKCNATNTGILTCVDGAWQESTCTSNRCQNGKCVSKPANVPPIPPHIIITRADDNCSMSSSAPTHRPLFLILCALATLGMAFIRRSSTHQIKK